MLFIGNFLQQKDGVQLDNSTCLLLLDLTPLCGDFTRAFIEIERQSNIPMKYYGITEPKEFDWQRSMISQLVIDALLEGTMKPPPGITIPEKDPPREHMDSEPAVPTFKRLTFNKVTDSELVFRGSNFPIVSVIPTLV